ncbi:MAG: retention module-containing protein, partial [Burkholderiaceae bacterium]|nr:retention module-containing protein [Sulfuritalea sp.]MCF8174684.1 retention module-containing protein [Burkholderiaceae bacterium]
MAVSGNVVGKVTLIKGKVLAKDPDGEIRELALGDPVYEGDVIMTPANGRIELAFTDGTAYFLRDKESVTLDGMVFGDRIIDANEAALRPQSSELDDIARAIAEGNSLDRLLEETAAGRSSGSAAEEGHSFVQLLRIAESVDPLGYEFGNQQGTQQTDFVGGSEGSNSGTGSGTESGAVAEVVTAKGPTVATVSAASATEATSIVHTVTLSNASTTATTYALSLSGGTATGGGTDYTSTLVNGNFSNGVTISGGTITVPAGVTSFTVSVPTTGDLLDEASETYNLTVGGITGVGTILDDDATPTLSVNDVTVNEAAGTASFTVSLSAAGGQSVTVGYNTSDGTATAGADYTATSGTLTFAPGETTKTVTVAITNDTVFEGAVGETFNLNLVSPTNATIADNLGLGTITDNDSAPVAVADMATIDEDTVNVTGTVITNDTLGDGTVAQNVTTLNGSATGSYGTITLGADGSYTYTLNNSLAAVQALDVGQKLSETYSYTLTDKDGDTSTANLVITINGAEDAPVLGGTVTGTVAEDGTQTASGGLTITDVDTNDNPVSFA